MTGLSLIALSRRLDTRRRLDRLTWAARSRVIAEQLRAMRATYA